MSGMGIHFEKDIRESSSVTCADRNNLVSIWLRWEKFVLGLKKGREPQEATKHLHHDFSSEWSSSSYQFNLCMNLLPVDEDEKDKFLLSTLAGLVLKLVHLAN